MKAKKKSRRSIKPNLRSIAAPIEATEQLPFLKAVTTRNTAAISAVLLCILTIAAYANSINNGFVWDDHQQIVMNLSLRPGAPFRDLIAPNDWAFARAGVRERINYYRPLQMVTYRLTANVFGLDARAFHGVNLALHIIVVLLAFALFRALTGSIGLAFGSAALFALHPIHTEAVDWIAALPDIGGTALFLAAFLFFLRSRGQISEPQASEPTRQVHVLFLAASLAEFAAALLWKESAIVFPLIVMAYVFCLSNDAAALRRLTEALKQSLSYWCILGLYFVLRLRVLGFIVMRQRAWILSRFEFGLTVLHLISAYWWKLLWPIHLNAYYVFAPVRTVWDPRAIAAILFLILTLIPVLNVYAVGRNVFCERYLYLPSVGFCLLIVRVAGWAVRSVPLRFRRIATTGALAGVVLFFAAWTAARNPVWQDDLALFTRTLESSPNAPFVEGMVAALQPNDAGGQISAESHYLRAIALAQSETPPDRSEMAIAEEGLASIYAARADFDAALRTLAQVRIADPKDPQVDGEEGLILTQAGRWMEAQAAPRAGLRSRPRRS
jgi:tetratricopeptide (TPR) repeat protein